MFWWGVLAFVLLIVGLSVVGGLVIAGRRAPRRDREDTPMIGGPGDFP